MATKENLQEAFAGESQANRKYTAFAREAEKNGKPMIAKLFKAAADAETVHALLHFKNMGGIGSTEENLKAAIEGEGFEFQQMYPKFVEEAEKDGAKEALRAFKWAMTVEETHHKLYSEALETLQSGKDLDAGKIHVCQCCGHTVIGDSPEKCPVCGASEKMFKEII